MATKEAISALDAVLLEALLERDKLTPEQKDQLKIVDDLNDPKVDPARLKVRREAFTHYFEWREADSQLQLMGRGSRFTQNDVDKLDARIEERKRDKVYESEHSHIVNIVGDYYNKFTGYRYKGWTVEELLENNYTFAVRLREIENFQLAIERQQPQPPPTK